MTDFIFNNHGGDPFEDQDTLETFLDALNEIADEVMIGDETWPSDDYAMHDRPVKVSGATLEDLESLYGEFVDKVVSLSPPKADDDSETPGGNADKADEVGSGLTVLRVIGGEGDLEGETVGLGVDFPNAGVYIDWLNDAWPEEEQLDGPHVSDYDSVDDLVQATKNEVEEIQTFETGDDEPEQKSSDSVTISGLTESALDSISSKYNVEIAR